MTDEVLLLGPLLPRGEITSLTGPPGLELAALTVAIAVSYKLGVEIINGWCPAQPGEVTVHAYEGTWVDWRSLVQDICDAAQVPTPVIHIEARSGPSDLQKPEERDPVAREFWDAVWAPEIEADYVRARAAGRRPPEHLYIVYGLDAATLGADGLMRRLYDEFRKRKTTTLMVGRGAFTEDTWGAADETWAGTYGPVLKLPDLRTQKGVGDFLAHPPAALVPVPRRRQLLGADASAKGDVEAFFTAQGVEALRAILTDGSSAESRRLKALARAQGITPGRLWHAAKRFADDALRSYELAFREATDSGLGILYGYAAVFNQWREVNSPVKGNYLQRIAPGAFAETIEANLAHMKVILQHGEDPHVGYKPLGPISVLEEDDYGLRYEVQLLDVGYVRHLVPWLHTGLYGGSLSFEVTADDFTVRPGKSAHNPRGIPEQTVREIRVQEFGPVYPPAYAGTSAGIRLPAN